jgi:hypothetical protein
LRPSLRLLVPLGLKVPVRLVISLYLEISVKPLCAMGLAGPLRMLWLGRAMKQMWPTGLSGTLRPDKVAVRTWLAGVSGVLRVDQETKPTRPAGPGCCLQTRG